MVINLYYPLKKNFTLIFSNFFSFVDFYTIYNKQNIDVTTKYKSF